MLTTALAAFNLLPLAWRLGIIGAAALTLAGTLGVVHHKIYQSGYDAAIADVAAENKEAIDAANKLKAKARGCSGTWSQSRGVCE